MTEIAHPTLLMPCPKCATPMRSIERSGIHLETCPECRGMFLDRGELDRLLDLEAASTVRSERPRRDDLQSDRGRYREDDDDDRRDRGGPWDAYGDDDDDRLDRGGPWGRDADDANRRPSRRGGFLSELFENLGG